MADRKRQKTSASTPTRKKRPPIESPGRQRTLDAFLRGGVATASVGAKPLSDEGWEQWPPGTFDTVKVEWESETQEEGTSEVVTTISGALASSSTASTNSTLEKAVPTEQSSLNTGSCAIDFTEFSSAELPSYWQAGCPTPYRWLVDQFVAVERVTTRQVITNILTNMLRTIIRNAPEDLLPALYLCTNSLAPPYEGVELGIGPQILLKTITSISDMSSKAVKAAWEKYGDWGDVVFTARVKMQMLVKPKALLVSGVLQTLRKIAQLKGQGTLNQKSDLIKKMMVACEGEELRYLTRTLVSHLRIGAVRTTILIALSHAAVLEHSFAPSEIKTTPRDAIKTRFKLAEQIIKECYAQVPNYDRLVAALLDPATGLSRMGDVLKCTVGIPIRPMLGKITRDLADVFEKLEGLNYCADFKYDGQRAQIHLSETGQVSIFSRHLETITDKFPDILSIIPSTIAVSTGSFIIDSEVVAVDEQGNILSFQTLSNRGRKNVALKDVTIGVCIFVFDLMYLNGESLIKRSFRERRDAMRSAFKEIKGRFEFVPQIETRDADELQEFLTRSLQAGCEGLMVKILDKPAVTGSETLLATYEPDKRTESWLKVKKDYVEGLADSLDLVPIGAWYGTGRKATWYSPFLMAAYNPETEQYETVCKCMSGFSDAFYKEMKIKYAKDSGNTVDSPKSYYAVSDALLPDVWFLPLEVWEIRGADLTLSPVHRAAAGRVDEVRGISLRFPRFIRTRGDKGPEDATTPDQISEMFLKQRQRAIEAPVADEDPELEEEEAQ
ncbi:DNA ligase I, ATP-dependent (dnl1) [Spizellomyces punctatus DAOM BR117]|uniref:DNA ligase n=1 Tax=Spizellomyces punctatus (strain DAOM BR117) TaxID=645134 RepID=A0A0L0HA21_SPIPD|nr:DNA ligase I, ATP-dependent (dnl1) [Spizellomyces punctatus DAOM BR117]KNC97744.1 DNA ligase I, ATP-dependent (dnl1) [Spizellomyces punctatus DAOM BR117]|eukprot:XP_016605784.1 DNA ligase I, ATP-dependent (dnl1) [Spizellomyces punctatus DAOM BR117]